MRKLVLILIAFFAVVTFIRAFAAAESTIVPATAEIVDAINR